MPVEIGNWHSRKDSHPHSWGAGRCPVSLGCVNLAAGELETLNSEHDGRIWFLSFPGNGQNRGTQQTACLRFEVPDGKLIHARGRGPAIQQQSAMFN